MDMYYLKIPYRKVLLPIAKKMISVDPDIISYLAVFVAAITMFCYIFASSYPILLIISILLTILRMTLNTLDGVIAIQRGNLRLKGEIVNALPDRYSDIFVFIGIAVSPLCNSTIGIIALSTALLTSYTGMLGKAVGVKWQHQGPIDKIARLCLIMIFSLIQYFTLCSGVTAMDLLGIELTYIDISMILISVLGQITIYNRLKGQLKEIEILESEKFN